MKMSVNGPMKMYKVKPLYDICPPINLPTCMYKMKNLYSDSMPSEKVKEVVFFVVLKLVFKFNT